MGTYFTTTTKTWEPITKLRHQNAEGSRTHQAHEAQRRAGRHRREEGGVEGRVHQAAVGLHQEAQPAGPREQAVLHPRQEDGQGLRRRPHPRLRHGQVPFRPPLLISQPFILPKKTKRKFTHIRLSFPCVQTIYTSFIPQSDQHLTTPRYIETTQVPPSPNWKMPNPRTGVDDGAFFKAARRTAIRRAETPPSCQPLRSITKIY